MKNTRTDLRTQKTYKALILAFQELIQEKPFEKITVKELCSRAQTRTATFYNHFSDKYDFFSFMIKELRKERTELAEIQYTSEHPENYYIQLIQDGFNFIEEHARMVENIESDTLLTTIMQTVSDEITLNLKSHLEKDMISEKHKNINPDIMAQIFIGAMIQCSRWWLENRKTVKKEDVLFQLSEVVRGIYK